MLRWGLWVIYAFTAVLGRPAFAQTNPSVAFFYGKPVPVGQLGRFDWVVVEPDHLDARGLDELQRAGVQVFAYLSLGEAAPEAIDPGRILGRNAPWGSVIVDPRAAGWRSRILARVDALAAHGFHGLILEISDHHRDVTTDVGACRELVEGRTPDDCEQGAAGAVVPFVDPDAVAREALSLLGDPGRWRAAQEAAIRRVETHYTEARVFDAYRRIYEEAHTWQA